MAILCIIYSFCFIPLQPERAYAEKAFVFRPISNTAISEAKPYTRAMTGIVEVQVLLDVITKYLARKCKCMDVKALDTTFALAAPST